jgi:hypothetical protein
LASALEFKERASGHKHAPARRRTQWEDDGRATKQPGGRTVRQATARGNAADHGAHHLRV